MDDRRFDSLVRSLGTGASRRSVLKGLLGFGGATLAGATLAENQTDAARRPTPTPKPVTCPGQQTPVGSECKCVTPKAPGTQKCGPDCCNPTGRGGAHSECCDNECCYGTCYGEELCCPTNPRSGERPPTHQICEGPNGSHCCAYEQQCCLLDGCCDTMCHGGSVGASWCCPAEDYCPGGDETEGICCTGTTTCCGGGTDARSCLDLNDAGTCCADTNCADDEQCIEHVCVPICVPGKVAVLVHSGSGPSGCSEGTHLTGVPVGLYDCDSGEVLYGPVFTNDDGYADFESIPAGIYCVHIPGDSVFSGCERCRDNGLYRTRIEVTCGQTVYPLIGICRQGQHCDSGICLEDDPCDGKCTDSQVCIDTECVCKAGYAGEGNECTACPAGTFSSVPGAVQCANCDLNFYQDQPGQTSCLPCAEGFYTEHVGSDECIECNCVLGNMPLICGCDDTPCDPGFGPVSGMCVKCLAGSASHGSACVPCPQGTFAAADGQTTCDPCPSGSYADDIGFSICTRCPAGSYQDALGQIGCKPCGYLTYTPAEGSTSCQACACTLDCDSITGGCFQVGPESHCSDPADCTTNICGCGANQMFPDCICRYATCGATGSACSYHLDCCIGDCVGDDTNGYFCIAEG